MTNGRRVASPEASPDPGICSITDRSDSYPDGGRAGRRETCAVPTGTVGDHQSNGSLTDHVLIASGSRRPRLPRWWRGCVRCWPRRGSSLTYPAIPQRPIGRNRWRGLAGAANRHCVCRGRWPAPAKSCIVIFAAA
jgi:hypothetical protein